MRSGSSIFRCALKNELSNLSPLQRARVEPANCYYDQPAAGPWWDPGATFSALNGGAVEEICSSDWAASFRRLGRYAFGPRPAWQLAGTPLGPVAVDVDGVAVAPGSYSYEPSTRTVLFSPSGTPGPGRRIRFSYTAACQAP